MTPIEIQQESLYQAESWLAGQQVDGLYRRYMRYSADTYTWSEGSFSAEITGYAAHYWSWRVKTHKGGGEHIHKELARSAADWLVKEWISNGLHLPFEPESSQQYFFDLGIASRGLFAAGYALSNHEYFDVANQMASAMTLMEWPELGKRGTFTPIYDFRNRSYFGWAKSGDALSFSEEGTFRNIWWSKGPFIHQRKAALAWKLAGDRGHYDLLDLTTNRTPFDVYSPAQVFQPSLDSNAEAQGGESSIDALREPAEKAAGSKTTSTGKNSTKSGVKAPAVTAPAVLKVVDRVEVDRWNADYCHPFAYSAEASCMGDISGDRGRRELAALRERIRGCFTIRTDAYSQMLRLLLYMNNGGVSVSDIAHLLDAQDRACGGFRFILDSTHPGEKGPSYDLSVHATIFACQAIAMATMVARNSIPDQKYPFGKRELAIV